MAKNAVIDKITGSARWISAKLGGARRATAIALLVAAVIFILNSLMELLPKMFAGITGLLLGIVIFIFAVWLFRR